MRIQLIALSICFGIIFTFDEISNKIIIGYQMPSIRFNLKYNYIRQNEFLYSYIYPEETLNGDKFVIGSSRFGFFSEFLKVLNNLAWAELNNKTPVVYWDENSLYYDAAEFKKNVWEYYFEPVSNLKYENGDKIYQNYWDPDGMQIPFWKTKDCFDKNVRIFFNQVLKKFIRIKPNITNKVESFYNKNIANKFTIGIHLRGTDKKREAKPIDPILILNKANELAKNYKNLQFFVATDEQQLLELAQKKLRAKVIYYDSYRSENGQAIHKAHHFNRSIIGQEVLIETLLLAKCDKLLHTRSNVSIAACIFSPELDNIFFEN